MNYALSPGVVLNGRYRIEQEIDHGGFSITYKAVDLKDESPVAIKELYLRELMVRNPGGNDFVVIDDKKVQELEQRKERTLQEAYILREFKGDPNIVSFYDQFRANNTAYIVMEFLDGIEVKDKIDKEGKIDPSEAFRYMIPIMQSMCKVHAAQITHRDIAPDNIMVLQKNKEYCLFDFGSAKALDAGETMSLEYKKHFAPIEQMSDLTGHPIGPWSDVYAFFATVFFMITGKEPETSVSRMYYDELVPPSEQGIEIDKRLEKILLKGMAVDPEDRYHSFEEAIEDLKKCLPPEFFRRRVPTSTPTPSSRLPWPLILSLLVAVLILIIAKCWPAIKEAGKFVGVKTERILVYPMPGHEEDFRNEKEAIRGRIELLTESVPTDIVENDKGELLVTTADELFEHSDPEDVFHDLLSGSFKCSIGYADEQGIVHSLVIPADVPEIKAVAEADVIINDDGTASQELSSKAGSPELHGAGYIVATMTEPVPDMLKELLEAHAGEEELHFYYDMDFLQNPDSDDNLREGSRVYVDKNCATWFAWTSDVDKALDHLSSNLRVVSYEDYVHARSRSDEFTSSSVVQGGKYQKDPDEIKGPLLKATYTPGSGIPNKGEIAMVEINMKARLDRLGRPYAITYEADGAICLTMSMADISPFVLKTLFMGSSNVRVTSTWLYRIGTISPTEKSVSLVPAGDGTYEALVVLDEAITSGESMTIKDKAERLLQAGDALVHIELDGVGSETYEGTYSHVVLAEGTPRIEGEKCVLAFRTLCTRDGEKVPITDENRYLLDYIGGLNRGTDYSNVSYRLDHIRCFDKEGNPTSDELGTCEAWIPNYQNEIMDAVGKTGIKSIIYCDETGAVTIDFDTSLSLNDAVSNIRKIYRACHFEDGRMRGIYFRAQNLTVSLDKTTETYEGYAITATASGEDGTPDENTQTRLLRRLYSLKGVSSGTAVPKKKDDRPTKGKE